MVNMMNGTKGTTHLQGIGSVAGVPAETLTVGTTMVWNYGAQSTVIAIVSATPKYITITEQAPDGYTANRRLKKSRIVATL